MKKRGSMMLGTGAHVRRRNYFPLIITAIFVFGFVASLISTLTTSAAANIFKIQNVEQTGISASAEGTITGFDEQTISSGVVFHHLNDYVEYTITLKNTDTSAHIIEAITDNNNNPYIIYDYLNHQNEQIGAGSDLVFVVTARYVNQADMNDRVSVNNVKFNIKFLDIEEDDEVIVVPDTGASTSTSGGASFSAISLIISALGLILICVLVMKKQKKVSRVIVALMICISAITFATTVKAEGASVNGFTFTTGFAFRDRLIVTYKDGNNNEHQEIINYGSLLNLENPVKNGYRFAGWKYADGSTFIASDPITDDISIEPVFTIDTYIISYDLAGGTTSEPNTTNYTVNDIVILHEPTKEHYVFAGWTGTGLDEPTKNVVIPAGSTGVRSYTATYSPIDYDITYSNITLEELALLNAPLTYNIETAPFTIGKPATRLDDDEDPIYTFVGWKEGSTISETITLPDANSMGPKIYEAQWAPVDATTYTISYELNGGTTATPNRTTFTKNDETFSIINPTKTGYTFKGWSGTDLTGDTNTDVQVVSGTRKNLSFEAHYTANTYKVVFNANGGTGNMADQTLTYDTAANLNANTYTKTGYSFGGWNTAAGGTGTAYTNGAEVENLKTEGEITLYAQWTANSYLVAFDCNHVGCEGTMENLPMVYDVEKALPLNVFSVPGYAFTGWGTEAAGDGDSYGNGAEVNNLAATGAITLYAQWTTVDYDISYELNGGTAENPATYTTEQTITLNNPTKTGYNFTGWSGTDLDGEDDMEVTIPAGSTGNRNYTANWSDPINYSIEYTGLDALTEEELAAFTNPTTYTIESSFTLSNPAHLGYQFVGWTGSNGDTLQTTVNVAAGTTGSLSYHANFAANTYTVVFEKNPGTHNIGGDMDAQAFIYDTEQALTDNAFTIDEPGFKYGGWNTEADGSGTHYDDKQTVENLTAENEGTVTLYAEWGRTPYTIAFDKNNENATGEMLPIENITYGEHITLPQVGFVYNDHKIASWNTEPDGSGRSYGDQADVVNVAIDGTVTLYAQWRDTEAVFLGGTRPKMKWIALAGGNQANITAIRQYAGTPDVTTFTDDNIVSEETSPDPIYTWYDNGTIYYWSEDNHPALSAFSREMFDGLTKAEVIEVKNLDTSNVTNMIYMFRNCSSLKSLDLSNFDTSKVTTMHQMFNGCSSLAELDVSTFDTKNVTDMHGMFANCSGLTELDVSNFDTSNVTTMTGMFQNDSGLTEIDITGFNTENAKSISGMFMGCTRLTEIDLSHMNTQKITDMSNLFRGCTNLENVIFGEDFKAEEVTTMRNMFMGCTSLKVLDLSTFEATKVTNVYQMFLYDNQLETIYVTNPEAFSNITDSQDMFHSCGSLVGGMGTVQSQIYRSGERAFIDLGPDRPGYFTDKTKLNVFYYPNDNEATGTMEDQLGVVVGEGVRLNANQYKKTGFKFGGWNTEPDGSGDHYDDEQIVTKNGFLKLYAQWGESPYTVIFDKNADDAQGNMESISKIYGEHFDLPASTFTRQSYIFQGWNTEADGSGKHYDDQENVINLDTDGEVTLYAEWLESTAIIADHGPNTGFSLNIKSLVGNNGSTPSHANYTVKKIVRSDTEPTDEQKAHPRSNVAATNSNFPVYIWFDEPTGTIYWWSEAETVFMAKRADYMFANFKALESVDVEDFDTSLTTSMAGLFNGDEALASIDLSNFDTDGVTDMHQMFSGCSALNSLDVSGFDTDDVTNMSSMFSGLANVSSLNVTSFNTENVENFSGMFRGMKNLTSLDVSGFNTGKATLMNEMFRDCEKLEIINVSRFNTAKVTSFEGMFRGCKAVEELDVSGFVTSSAQNISAMFYGCSSITELDLHNFNTSNVISMNHTFLGLTNVEVLDLSTFDTKNVTGMQYTFSSDVNLKTIYVTDKFVTSAIPENSASSQLMFYQCGKLVGGLGTKFSGQFINHVRAHIDGGPDNPGYFTDIADKP